MKKFIAISLILSAVNVFALDIVFVCKNKLKDKALVITYSDKNDYAPYTILKDDNSILGMGIFDIVSITNNISNGTSSNLITIGFMNYNQVIGKTGVVGITLSTKNISSLDDLEKDIVYRAKSDSVISYGSTMDDIFRGSSIDCEVLTRDL